MDFESGCTILIGVVDLLEGLDLDLYHSIIPDGALGSLSEGSLFTVYLPFAKGFSRFTVVLCHLINVSLYERYFLIYYSESP